MILAIESSCDESALALFDPSVGLVGEWVHSQIALHGTYGGVVPDLASREHLRNFGPLLERLIEGGADLSRVERLAVTCGPGLAGCLALGVAMGKALSLALGRPLVGVNHLRGHVFSPFIGLHKADPAAFEARYAALLPHLGLLVSGGNTLLFCIGRDRSLRLLAQTVDDAAGEALDKGAKLLGLPYPGGPLIEKLAVGGNAARFDFPRATAPGPEGEVRFSFSGLKTSLRYMLEKMDDPTLEACRTDLCASYQEAVVDQLSAKTAKVLAGGAFASLGLSGGVANNKRLRGAMAAVAEKAGIPVLIAEPRHTGDNAGMIAFAAWADPVGVIQAEAGRLAFHPSLPLVE